MSSFVRAPSKASLLAMLKKAKEITPRLLRSLFDGVMFKSEMTNWIAGGGVDHGVLSGLGDDDHSVYIVGSRPDWTDLTDGGDTSLHTHLDDCPAYKYIKVTSQAEGDMHLSDGSNWATSEALIKQLKIETSSADWDAWILQNDNGYATNDANIPAIQLMSGGNGDEIINIDFPYQDEDATDEVHLYIVSGVTGPTFDVCVRGYGLKL